MSINILQSIQKNLGYPPLLKIDANTQEVANKKRRGEDRFGQAAIPAILIALYEFSRNDEAAEKLLQGDPVDNWVAFLFNGHASEAIEKVCAYSNQSFGDSHKKMNVIAGEAVRLIKEQTGANGTLIDIKNLLASQRNDVLPYLPASMQIGVLLNDSTLDDRTNKMQGPISTIMHAIGNELSGSDVDGKRSST